MNFDRPTINPELHKPTQKVEGLAFHNIPKLNPKDILAATDEFIINIRHLVDQELSNDRVSPQAKQIQRDTTTVVLFFQPLIQNGKGYNLKAATLHLEDLPENVFQALSRLAHTIPAIAEEILAQPDDRLETKKTTINPYSLPYVMIQEAVKKLAESQDTSVSGMVRASRIAQLTDAQVESHRQEFDRSRPFPVKMEDITQERMIHSAGEIAVFLDKQKEHVPPILHDKLRLAQSFFRAVASDHVADKLSRKYRRDPQMVSFFRQKERFFNHPHTLDAGQLPDVVVEALSQLAYANEDIQTVILGHNPEDVGRLVDAQGERASTLHHPYAFNPISLALTRTLAKEQQGEWIPLAELDNLDDLTIGADDETGHREQYNNVTLLSATEYAAIAEKAGIIEHQKPSFWQQTKDVLNTPVSHIPERLMAFFNRKQEQRRAQRRARTMETIMNKTKAIMEDIAEIRRQNTGERVLHGTDAKNIGEHAKYVRLVTQEMMQNKEISIDIVVKGVMECANQMAELTHIQPLVDDVGVPAWNPEKIIEGMELVEYIARTAPSSQQPTGDPILIVTNFFVKPDTLAPKTVAHTIPWLEEIYDSESVKLPKGFEILVRYRVIGFVENWMQHLEHVHPELAKNIKEQIDALRNTDDVHSKNLFNTAFDILVRVNKLTTMELSEDTVETCASALSAGYLKTYPYYRKNDSREEGEGVISETVQWQLRHALLSAEDGPERRDIESRYNGTPIMLKPESDLRGTSGKEIQFSVDLQKADELIKRKKVKDVFLQGEEEETILQAIQAAGESKDNQTNSMITDHMRLFAEKKGVSFDEIFGELTIHASSSQEKTRREMTKTIAVYSTLTRALTLEDPSSILLDSGFANELAGIELIRSLHPVRNLITEVFKTYAKWLKLPVDRLAKGEEHTLFKQNNRTMKFGKQLVGIERALMGGDSCTWYDD